MPKIQEIYNILNQIAPFGSALPYDNAGLLVGDADRQVQKIGVCLDITAKAIDAAVTQGCDLIVSHHPVIFDPLKQISPVHPAYRLISENIAAICAHTNLPDRYPAVGRSGFPGISADRTNRHTTRADAGRNAGFLL